MNAIDTIEYRGFTIEIHPDTDAGNPRTEWDNLCTMVCWHRRYNLGDKHDFKTPYDFRQWAADKKIFILPLYLYDHSGISISCSDFQEKWDSGQVGWIYISHKKMIEEFGKADEKQASKIMKGEVEVYDQYLTGQVYGFIIEPTDRNKGISCDESCWGFYGDTSYMISEAKGMIDHCIKEYRERIKAEHAEEKAVDALVRNTFAL